MPAPTLQAVPKLYDVIIWLMGRVEKFPRSQKFTLGDRTLNLALDTLELLIEATYTRDRLTLLRKANVQEKLRYLIRICHDFKMISAKQYAYISNGPRRRAHEVASRGFRVVRGGSWNNNTENVRVAYRNYNTPTNTNNNNGFRCAKTLVEKAFSVCQSWYASEVGESYQACMNEESKACYLC